MNPRDAFFEALASDADYFTSSAAEMVGRPDFNRNATSIPVAFQRIGEALRERDMIGDFTQIMREQLLGYAHSILVQLDGGGILEGVSVVDSATGEELGEGLHELFFAYLFDT